MPAFALSRTLACLAVLAVGAAALPGPAQAGPAQRQAAAANATLQVGALVPGFPHKVDVYRPAGATRAIVFLHAHGGRTWQLAYDLGINRRYGPVKAANVEWADLEGLGVIAIFPQGQVAPGGVLPTWSNHVLDSGQDDVAFLAALSAHARSAWGAQTVSLAGHSSGGTMTARMWCEGTPAYRAFFSIAGPMPSSSYPQYGTTCTPLAPAPYAVVIGNRDSKLGMFAVGITQPTPEQTAAGLTDSILVSEWSRHADRGELVCGDVTALDDAGSLPYGPSWNACQGRLRFTIVDGADHPIASIEQHAGRPLLDWIAGFDADPAR